MATEVDILPQALASIADRNRRRRGGMLFGRLRHDNLVLHYWTLSSYEHGV